MLPDAAVTYVPDRTGSELSGDAYQWFTLYLKQLAAHLRGGFEFVLAPRRYLRSIETEATAVIVARVCALGIAFAAAELLLAARSLAPHQVLWLGLLETLFGLGLVPVFYVVVRLFGGRHPWRVALVYVLTARFTLMLPVVAAYVLFLTTEDYVFALLRGVLGALYLLLVFTILPFAYFDRLRARFLSLIVALISFWLYTSALDAAFVGTETSGSHLAEFSIFYDPIGAEVDRLAGVRRAELDVYEPPEFKRASTLISGGELDSTGAYLIFSGDSLRALASQWESEEGRARSRWNVLRARLKERSDSATFGTTRKLLRLRLSHLDVVEDIGRDMDRFAAEPRARHLLPISSAYGRMLDAHLTYLREANEHMSVRVRLLRLGVIDSGAPTRGDSL